MLNSQPRESRVMASNKLDVHSIFYTIQGEGPFCGSPAVFIRLAGCNLQCPMCDTDYTSGRTQFSVGDLIERCVDMTTHITRERRQLVVITGGEPFRQQLKHLINALVDCEFYVQIETNGTLRPPEIEWSKDVQARNGAYLVVSPKAGKLAPGIAAAACAFKYVMNAESISAEDGLPILALAHGAHPQVARPGVYYTGPIYLQPMDAQSESANEHNRACCVQSCLKYGYTLQLQIHKIVGVA